jgi:3-phosphoshikimate 1-carboxyvinyltransferase
VEGDWSQAAFWYAAAFLDNPVTPAGLNPGSVQGDRVVSDLYWRLARPGSAEIDLSGCPDLLPPLAVMAAVRSGETRFTHARRLRLKESDRLHTVCALLKALGCQASELPEGLAVRGGSLSGGTVDGAGDHRIVMAAAIAASACAGPVTIRGAEAVNKSDPSFWDEYASLGGEMHVL